MAIPYRWTPFNGEQVLSDDIYQETSGRINSDLALSADFWLNGTLSDPNGLSQFQITVDGTTPTLINVNRGVGYVNGYRLLINEDTTYNSLNPTITTNGVCTPISSGNRGIPLASYVNGIPNYLWLSWLEQKNTSPKAISTFDGSIHYIYDSIGYQIVINTTNEPGNTQGLSNAIYLGTVYGQGSGQPLVSAPTGICQISQQFAQLNIAKSVPAYALQNNIISAQHINSSGGNFTFNSACFSTLVASSNITVPIQPLQPTSAASRRFAQYAEFGIAVSQTQFTFNYDGNNNIINVIASNDNVGTISVAYDGLCNVIKLSESIDGYNVNHLINWSTVNGLSAVSSIIEDGI